MSILEKKFHTTHTSCNYWTNTVTIKYLCCWLQYSGFRFKKLTGQVFNNQRNCWSSDLMIPDWTLWCHDNFLKHFLHYFTYSISQEICTRFLLCCALLWFYIDWFSHIHQALLHWHCGNLTIAPVPAKQPWWIWINTSCERLYNHNKAKHNKTVCIFLGIYCMWGEMTH